MALNHELILHIETSTDVCSVALSDGDELLAMQESSESRSHATLLNRFIWKVLTESRKKMSDLQAVCVSKGPGSYTGLRIGVSTAKGLTYALDIPLISIGTLDSMVQGFLGLKDNRDLSPVQNGQTLLCPMLDARRMEVYTALYSPDGNRIREVSAEIIHPESFQTLLDQGTIYFFGNGNEKCKQVIDHPNAVFIDGIHPSASDMIHLARNQFLKGQFEDVAYFEPFYLKDFIATKPRKKLL